MKRSSASHYVPETKGQKISASTIVPLSRSSLDLSDVSQTTIDALPDEIMTKIFSHYLEETVDQVDFFKNITRVSSKWKLLSSNPKFWLSFDGTIDMMGMISCAEDGLLDYCETVKMPRCCWDRRQLESVLQRMKNIRCLNLSNMRKISKEHWKMFTKHFRDIREIVFGEDADGPTLKNRVEVKDWFSVCGPSLLVVDVSNCLIENVSSFFQTLASCCPNLRELKTEEACTHLSGFQFPVREMQRGCPKLEKLDLNFDSEYQFEVINAEQDDLAGFPQLRKFHYSIILCPSWVYKALLFASTKLEVLELHFGIEPEVLLSLPLENLHTLVLQLTFNSPSPYGDITFWEPDALSQVLKRFSRQLKSLALYNVKNEEASECLEVLALPDGSSKLQRLDIRWSRLKPSTVLKLLEHCKDLVYMNLNKCNYMDETLSKKYKGKAALKVLEVYFGIEPEMLLSLPLENLHTLVLSVNFNSLDVGISCHNLLKSHHTLWEPDALSQVLKRFSRQLKSLALYHVENEEAAECLEVLALPDGSSKLQRLDIRWSYVKPSTVLKLLEHCKDLVYMNLNDCKYMDETLSKKYKGKAALKVLYDCLKGGGSNLK